METKLGKDLKAGDTILTHKGGLYITYLGERVSSGSWDEMRGHDRLVHGLQNGVKSSEIIIGDLLYDTTA